MSALRWAVAGWAFMGLLGIPVLVVLDPFGGWRWEPRDPVHDRMIVSIHVAVGFCSLRAIRRPLEHASSLWFVVWSSLAHGGIRLFHAVAHRAQVCHLAGDVWILAGGTGLAVPLHRAPKLD